MLVTIAYQRDGAVSGRHRWVRGASTLPHRTHSSGWWCAGDGGVVTDRVEDFRHVCYGRCLQYLHQLRVLARLCHIDRSFAIDVLCKGPYIERRGMVVSVIRRTWGERVRVRMCMCMRMRVRAASSSLSPPSRFPPLAHARWGGHADTVRGSRGGLHSPRFQQLLCNSGATILCCPMQRRPATQVGGKHRCTRME